MEIWKAIEEYEGLYQVSDLGRVKSFKWGKERILKGTPNKKGYLTLDLNKECNRKKVIIHRIVAQHFVETKLDYTKLQVNHKDGVKTNNVSTNLEWSTNQENCIHARDNKLRFITLSWEDINEIRRLSDEGMSRADLARKYKVVPQHISKVVLNRRWKI